MGLLDLAKIGPMTPPHFCFCRTLAAGDPRSYSAQSRFERQAAPLESPETKHDDKGQRKRPYARMNQKKKNGGKGARIKREKTRWFLGIAPMKIHKER